VVFNETVLFLKAFIKFITYGEQQIERARRVTFCGYFSTCSYKNRYHWHAD